MDQNAVTFGLAGAGYILLAKDTALRLAGRPWPALGVLTALIVLVHVALVWAFRFEWSFTKAWEKSPPAFLIFHSALLLILLAPLAAPPARDRLTWIAFAIVSAGALPAPFRYPELQLLAIPLLAAFIAVVTVFLVVRRRNTGSTKPST
jgi:hypothetical protein